MCASEKKPARRGLRVVQVFGAATALGLVAAGQFYLATQFEGEGLPFVAALIWAMPFWYTWALMVPLVVFVARRLPFEKARLLSTGLLHLALALLFSLAHSIVLALIQWSAQPAMTENQAYTGFFAFLMAFAAFELSSNLLAYGAIVGGTHAVDYYKRFREREVAASRLATQLAQAQVRALRMQLNPHFLFNAMNSIAMLIRHQKRDEAVRTIAGLSDLLRYVLEETRDQEVQLHQELEFAKRYLAIEQIRFHDRLQVRIDAEPEVLDALVPNLILQPLVENAIRHGIARRAAAGLVTVSARRSGASLQLSVTDDGPGLTDIGRRGSGNGVGISNTRARLEQLYGDRQAFEIVGADSYGVVVTVTVPFHTEPNPEPMEPT
jgi:signal transduction histidine kinase